MSRSGSIIWSISVRNSMNVAESFRGDDLTEDGAVDHVHRGHQRDRPVPDVLELPSGHPPGSHRGSSVFTGLGLDTGLLIDAQQHRVLGWVPVQLTDRPGLVEERG